MNCRQTILSANLIIIFAVSRSHMNNSGAVFRRHKISKDNIPPFFFYLMILEQSFVFYAGKSLHPCKLLLHRIRSYSMTQLMAVQSSASARIKFSPYHVQLLHNQFLDARLKRHLRSMSKVLSSKRGSNVFLLFTLSLSNFT